MDEFRSRLNYGALVALVLIGLLYLLKPYIPAASWREVSINAWMGATTTNLINLMTAYLWVVLVLEAYRSVKVQNAMKPLVSYGRMGLTNYIVQSVTGVFIFSGFGLDWSHLGVFLSVLVCLGFTAIQIAFSQYWAVRLALRPDGVVMADRHVYEMATHPFGLSWKALFSRQIPNNKTINEPRV